MGLEDYLGNRVRRTIFMVKKGNSNTYQHLFSVFELLTDPFVEANWTPNINNVFIYFERKRLSGKEDKVYFAVDECIIDKDMIIAPQHNLAVGKDKINPWEVGYHWNPNDYNNQLIVPSNENDNNVLKKVLPRYNNSLYVNMLIPDSVEEFVNYVEKQRDIKKQLSILSKKHLGFDLTDFQSLYGSYIFVKSNPYYTKIDFSCNKDTRSLYCRVNYRKGSPVPLYFDISGKDDNGSVLWGTWERMTNLCFVSKFDLPGNFKSLDIKIFGPEKSLIDYYENMTFISSITFNMNIKEKDVVYKDSKGRELTAEKFSSEKFTVGKSEMVKSLMGASDEYSYKRFEESLDFIFFDGDKEHKEENKEKARTIIHRIINTANEECYIVDPYFGINEFVDYIIPIKLQSIPIKIISSKLHLKQLNNQLSKSKVKTLNAREYIKSIIKELSLKNISKVSCRLMTGENPISHDRFIVADNNVWIVGCSLNQLGGRAAVIARVPQGYAPKIIRQIKTWWNNDENMEDL